MVCFRDQHKKTNTMSSRFTGVVIGVAVSALTLRLSVPSCFCGATRVVVCLLEQKDVVILGATCRAFRSIERAFAIGQHAFPLGCVS